MEMDTRVGHGTTSILENELLEHIKAFTEHTDTGRIFRGDINLLIKHAELYLYNRGYHYSQYELNK